MHSQNPYWIHYVCLIGLTALNPGAQIYAEESQVVSGAPTAIVDSEPASVLGITVDRLLQLRGAPNSRLTVGTKESLFYSDFIYTAENGRIMAFRPKNYRAVGAKTGTTDLTNSPGRVDEVERASLSESSGTPESTEALRSRIIDAVKPKVDEWARQKSRNTGEWYSETYAQGYESFTPVSGWPNRYCLIGQVNIYSSRRHATLRFEALVQLEDSGLIKNIEISLRN